MHMCVNYFFLLLLNSHCSDALITQTNCMTRFRLKYDFNCALRLPALRLLGLMCPSNIHTYICILYVCRYVLVSASHLAVFCCCASLLPFRRFWFVYRHLQPILLFHILFLYFSFNFLLLSFCSARCYCYWPYCCCCNSYVGISGCSCRHCDGHVLRHRRHPHIHTHINSKRPALTHIRTYALMSSHSILFTLLWHAHFSCLLSVVVVVVVAVAPS